VQDAATTALAQILPLVVDKLTPNGQIPGAAELQGLIGGLLGGGRRKA
jgi:uncharacterized protein YidB (DUF937 family)